ncbi:hypothetical protein niasHS_014350 [Heterodera schachtii]|uniref:Lon proteolytic domain-containing protein n=1 Tax=Heterodera schachtii TaxID=97005 RepID=A0ABD2IBJ7_HETSC
MAPGDDGKVYDAPMIGVTVGLSRSGTSGGLIYFEVAETDPFNANSSKNSLVITAGGGMLDTLATDSIIIARCAAKKIMREQQNSYLDRANLHLNIVSTDGSSKAGPSGGLAEGIAFVSMATKKKPIANLAMTGHLTLNGAVLPIGSIKQRVIAAKEAKMTNLMVPIGNKKEFDELKLDEVTRNGMHVQFVATFADAIRYCFSVIIM